MKKLIALGMTLAAMTGLVQAVSILDSWLHEPSLLLA